MSVEPNGRGLIFLISQPRAGSTLLQRILGGHPQIHTLSEPWVMLHPFYAVRPNGYEAEYEAHKARKGTRDFIEALPGGEADYLEGVRRMYSYLYGRTLVASGKAYFLDKTPRYYLILPELFRTFPESQFIFLLRNPLAVLSSILSTFVKGEWYLLNVFRDDLLRAPGAILRAMDSLTTAPHVVRYELLVTDPDREVRQLCERLGLEFRPEMIEYGDQEEKQPQWALGDKKSVHLHHRPVAQKAEGWQETLADPQAWRLARDYLDVLGDDTVKRLGYDGDDLRRALESHRPAAARLWFTYPLKSLLDRSREEFSKPEIAWIRLTRSIRQRGWTGTLRRLRNVSDNAS